MICKNTKWVHFRKLPQFGKTQKHKKATPGNYKEENKDSFGLNSWVFRTRFTTRTKCIPTQDNFEF